MRRRQVLFSMGMPVCLLDRVPIEATLEIQRLVCVYDSCIHTPYAIAEQADLVIMRWLYQAGGLQEIMKIKCDRGRCRCTHNKSPYAWIPCDYKLMMHATIGGSLEMVMYLREVCGMRICEDSLAEAAMRGRLDIIKYFCEKRNAPVAAKVLSAAHMNNQLEIVRYFDERLRIREYDLSWLAHAVEQNWMPMMEYLLAHPKFDQPANLRRDIDHALYVAAINDNLAAAQRFISLGGQCDITTLRNAIKPAVDYELIELLCGAVKSPYPPVVMNNAIMAGRLDIVQLLHRHYMAGMIKLERTVECSTWAINVAAESGYLDIIRYLWILYSCSELAFGRQEFCTYYAIDHAAENGHYDMVVYLVDRGFECTSAAIDSAARADRFDIIEYIYEHLQVRPSYSASIMGDVSDEMRALLSRHTTCGRLKAWYG